MSKPGRSPDPTTRAEFVAHEKKVWTELTATWKGLPDKALTRPGACGPEWSIKDVINHLAAWQEAALRVTHDLLEGRWGRLGSNTDKFNALHQAEDQARSLAATQRRLSQARRELLALLETVPEKRLLDLNDRIGWWVKYSTYGHYSEHIWELTEFRQRL